MIKLRLQSCSNKEVGFFDNLFGFKDDGSSKIKLPDTCVKGNSSDALYLHQPYYSFLAKKMELPLDINMLDRFLMVIFIEERIKLLSEYLLLEIMRQKYQESNDKLIDLLKKLMSYDKEKLKKNKNKKIKINKQN